MDRGIGVVVLAAAVLIALIGFVGCLDRALHSAGASRERGLKPPSHLTKRDEARSLPSRERGLKPRWSTERRQRASGRALRGSVD